MNELEEMSRDFQEKKFLLKDIIEEIEISLNRLRVIIGKIDRNDYGNLLEKMEKSNQVHVEDTDNECLGDMQ